MRLRVPASLAVALLGAGATVATSFAGCQEESKPDPADAGMIEKRIDAGADDATVIDGEEELADASVGDPDAAVVPPDAPRDARPDAPPDARPDAAPT